MRTGIDVLIAAFCIECGYTLLHRGRDYSGFAQCGLRVWRH